MDPSDTPSGIARPRRSRKPHPFASKAWAGLGRVRSLRTGLLLVTAIAVAPLVAFASGMALLRAADAHRLATAAAWATAAALPVLIGVLAVAVVGVAYEAMFMQWLSYLERLSRAYARGRYSLRPRRLQQAPVEFRALGEAVEDMAAAVEHRDQALREALVEQTVLLREVHHRVKNNLQIVGSLLSLQASRLSDPMARDALLDALVRIDAMSMGQRFMQQQEDEDHICSTELFETLAGQLRARLGGERRRLTLTTDIEPLIMPLDTGSRLSLIAAEAVICAYRAHGPDALVCKLAARADPDGVRMTLACSDEPQAFAAAGDRVSRDLINGYVRQLRGRLQADPGSGSLSVTAPLPRAVEAQVQPRPGPETDKHPGVFQLLQRTHSDVES